MPEIYVIGGCNGSGKTTFALNIFLNIGNIEFINAEREALASPVVEDDLRSFLKQYAQRGEPPQRICFAYP